MTSGPEHGSWAFGNGTENVPVAVVRTPRRSSNGPVKISGTACRR